MALFPPLVGDVLVILTGVISIFALVIAAYSCSSIISGRKQFDKIDKIDRLEDELKKTQTELSALSTKRKVNSAPERAAAAPTEIPPVWQAFLADYNSLAVSMDVPKADQACEAFVNNYGLALLICVDHAAKENGQTSPKFAPVEQIAVSQYWAWPLPEQAEEYIVVPNPLHPYDQKAHAEGGMKETFASNYEQGSYHMIHVKLPASFRKKDGAWKISQPGVIQVK